MLYDRSYNALRSLKILLAPGRYVRYASTAAAPSSSTPSTASKAARAPGPGPPTSAFASYTVSIPPTAAQIQYANRYFETGPTTFLSSSPEYRTVPISSVPEVAFLGRSNVGKSSVLNALLDCASSKIAHVSKRPGRTKLMNAFGVGHVKSIPGGAKVDEEGMAFPGGAREMWVSKGGLVVMDMPGYGQASREQWGTEIVKYLTSRKQLRQTFVLVDSEHGVKEIDLQLLQVLWHNHVPYQVVLSKVDKVVHPHPNTSPESLTRNLDKLPKLFERVRKHAERQDGSQQGLPPDVITCSSTMPPRSRRKIGMDNLRWAVLCAAGLDCDANGKKRQLQVESN